jgi:hypothetical protein
MSRVPHAAKALRSELEGRYKAVNMTAAGDPDGFGVRRTVQFDGAAGKFLAKVLPHLNDPRIANFSTKGKVTTVEFVTGRAADTRDLFHLDDGETVASRTEPTVEPANE